MIVGFLHPGAMGASLAAACSGRTVWCSAGRSAATRERAVAAGLEDLGSVADLAATADVVVAVCPPGSALDVADEVVAAGFAGIYVDVNAIAPATARRIGERFDHFVDGGVVGPPADVAGTTRLYLSGAAASVVAALWEGSALEVRLVEGGPGAASAVKACYAAWTKGTAALLLAVRALARAEGVEPALLAEWATSLPALAAQSERTANANAPKAWRFAGEMDEIAAAFAAHDLPAGFHHAAAELYERLAGCKDRDDVTLDEVLAQLTQ